MTQTLVDYYALLGVARTATPAEIERAIRQGIRTWSKQTARPELERRQDAERKMRHLKEAREILLDDARRRAYDQQLATAAPPSHAGEPEVAGEAGEWLELARRSLEIGDYRTAVRAAQEAQAAQAANQRSAEVWGIRARANAGLGRYDDAVFEARRAVQLAPDDLDHRHTLAASYEQAGDWANALVTYQDLARRDAGSVVPLLGQASVHVSAGNPGPAITMLEDLYQRGGDREVVGDYLAMALNRAAELVPAVREDDGYVITAPTEIGQMRGLLRRAEEVASDPGVRAGVLDTRAYVEQMAGREFVWQRLFGVWARRLVKIGLPLLLCTGVGGQAFESLAALFAPVVVGMVAGLAGLVAYALVPRWKFNRAAEGGPPLTY